MRLGIRHRIAQDSTQPDGLIQDKREQVLELLLFPWGLPEKKERSAAINSPASLQDGLDLEMPPLQAGLTAKTRSPLALLAGSEMPSHGILHPSPGKEDGSSVAGCHSALHKRSLPCETKLQS
jgi:hypothetical protein